MWMPEPQNWISGYTSDGTTFTMPIATFPQLTAAEADTGTGDIRRLLFALSHELYEVWKNTNPDNGERPEFMTISKSSTVNNDLNRLTHTFTFRFVCEISGQEVLEEI